MNSINEALVVRFRIKLIGKLFSLLFIVSAYYYIHISKVMRARETVSVTMKLATIRTLDQSLYAHGEDMLITEFQKRASPR